MAHLHLCNTMKASRSFHATRAAPAARTAPLAATPLRARPLPSLYRPQQPRQAVRLHALPNMGKIFQASQLLVAVQRVWDKYDTTDDGNLTLEEVTVLLNSQELGDYVQQITNVRPLTRTKEQIAPLFAEADANKSNTLSRTEFVALYLKLIAQRVTTDPKVLLQALLGAIDWNRDGAISGAELKRLVSLVGVPGLLTAPIPDTLSVDYTKATSLLGMPPPSPRAPAGDAPKPSA